MGLLLLVVASLWYSVAAAQAPQEAIAFEQSTAQPDFPYGITFAVTAASSGAAITEVDLLYGATRSEALTIVPTEVRPGQQVQAQHFLDTRIFYVPPGTELTYRWVIRDAAGNTTETPAQQLTYHDERFPWQERSERGVTVFWYEGDAAFGEGLIETSTRTLDRLEQEIGATVEDAVKVYIYANTNDMRSALQTNNVEWVGGQAWPGLGLIVGTVAPGDLDEARRIIPHELSHQVLHQAVENPYGGLPLWFDEGLAVYNQETPDTFFPIIIERAATTDQLIPLDALASSFPADTDRALLSYAQSHSVVAYMIETYGNEKMAELVATFQQAVPVEAAIPQVLGVSVDELDAAWRATLPPPDVSVDQEGGPAVAPADRFAGAPVLPDGGSTPAAPAVPERPADTPAGEPAAPQQPGTAEAERFSPSVPLIFQVAIAAIICVGLLLTGVVVFFVWRLTTSGQRV